MSIARKNLEHPVLVLIVFALLAAVGLFTLKNVALGLFPDIDSPYVMVSATYANAGPESVEKTVTEILEGALISVNGLKNLYSTSTESGSSIQLEFNYGIDIESAVNDIRDKLGRVQRQLPDAVNSPTIFRFNGDSKPIMRIAVRGNRALSDIKEIAEDTISDIFEQADGVAEASVMGGKTKIVRIELDQNRLAAYGFTVSQVSSALAKQNLDLGGGKLNEGQKDYVVRTTGEFKSLEEISTDHEHMYEMFDSDKNEYKCTICEQIVNLNADGDIVPLCSPQTIMLRLLQNALSNRIIMIKDIKDDSKGI